MAKCEASYQRQLILGPNSTHTMRRYANFLEEVSNNLIEAHKYNFQADDMEEAVAKEFKTLSASVVMNEQVCLTATAC